MTEYPSNSITPQKKPEKRKPVIKSGIIKRQEPLIYRIFGGNIRETGDYLLWDVLIPALKDTIIDMIQNGIEGLVHGDTSGGRSRRSRTKRHRDVSYVSYGDMYDTPRKRTKVRSSENRFSEYIFISRADADEVLSTMLEIIDTYDAVSVYEFLELIGQVGEYTDNKYGWDNLARAKIARVRGGFALVLPDPIVID